MSVTIASMMIGVRVLIMPRLVSAATGTSDGWISVCLGTGLTLIAGAIAALLASMFFRQGFFEFAPRILGTIPGYVLSSVYIVYFMFFTAYELRVLGEVVRFYLLPNTSLELLLLLTLMPVIYLLYGGMNPIIRIQQMFFPIIMGVILFLIALAYNASELKNLQPIIGHGIMPIMKGLPKTAFSFLGFGIIMIFAAHMQKPREALKAIMIAVSITGVINVVSTLFTIFVFGHIALQTLVFPLVELAKVIEIPGGFVERLELLFLTIWVMTIFSTVSIGLFVSSYGVEKLYGIRSRKNVLFLVPIVFMIALSPENLNDTFKMGDWIEKIGVFYVGTVPAILFMIAKIRKLDQPVQSPPNVDIQTQEEVQC